MRKHAGEVETFLMVLLMTLLMSMPLLSLITAFTTSNQEEEKWKSETPYADVFITAIEAIDKDDQALLNTALKKLPQNKIDYRMPVQLASSKYKTTNSTLLGYAVSKFKDDNSTYSIKHILTLIYHGADPNLPIGSTTLAAVLGAKAETPLYIAVVKYIDECIDINSLNNDEIKAEIKTLHSILLASNLAAQELAEQEQKSVMSPDKKAVMPPSLSVRAQQASQQTVPSSIDKQPQLSKLEIMLQTQEKEMETQNE